MSLVPAEIKTFVSFQVQEDAQGKFVRVAPEAWNAVLTILAQVVMKEEDAAERDEMRMRLAVAGVTITVGPPRHQTTVN